MKKTTAAKEIHFTVNKSFVVMAMLVIGHGFIHLFSSAFYIFIPEIKFSLGLTNAQVGALSATRQAAGGIANPPDGFIYDHFRSWWQEILGISIIAYGIGGTILGVADNYLLALAASLLVGIAHTLWHPPAVTVLSSQFETKRGLALSVHGSGGSTGETIGPTIVGILVGLVGWRLVAVMGIVPAALSGLAIWAVLRSAMMNNFSTESPPDYWTKAFRLLTDKHLFVIFLMAGCFSGAQSVIITFLPVYLRESIGLSSTVLGIYLSLAQVTGILSQPAMGYLSDRFSRKIVLIPAFFGFTFFSGVLYIAPSGWMLIAAILALGTVLFAIFAIILALGIDSVRTELRGMAVSMVSAIAFLSAAVSPAIAGFIADSYGIRSTFLLAAAIALAGACCSVMSQDQSNSEGLNYQSQ